MKPRVSFITLAVDDLNRSLAFYRDGLGWSTKGIVGSEIENGAVVFFDCEGGLKLALWPRRSMATESGAPLSAPGAPAIALAQNVESKEAVHALMQRAEQAGAQVLRQPHTTGYGGFVGYFRDPDGHLWEIAFNPDHESLG